NTVLKVLDKNAKDDESGRAYGGILRSVKGKLQEHITEEIIKIAWESIGGEPNRLQIDSKKHKIPIKIDYVNKIKDKNIKKHILENIDNFYYSLSVDKQVSIDDNFVLAIECKAYTENAMLKRILIDFHLLKTKFPNLSCYLFQLESQLGGDYSKLTRKTFGSHSTHTLMSYFDDVELKIVTFLKGERKIDKPIHIFLKPLEKKQIVYALKLIAEDLNKFL
ncbi:restriction endonuclease, partial [bacterium]|nr:restriction endonuclease [bacterium]